MLAPSRYLAQNTGTIANAAIIGLDNEGQFGLRDGNTLTEAILARSTFDDAQYTELRNWFISIGIADKPENLAALSEGTKPKLTAELETVLKTLYDQYN